jgi:hypothetical protein
MLPGCRRRRGFRTRWPPSVTVVAVTGTMNAVTGAMTAVTWGHHDGPALDVTGTGSAVIAVAGCRNPCQSLSRRADGPGRSISCHTGVALT